ncbi:hypothetical protein [Micromonospora sp. MA102]|uniref:hypothetical protein n=1 Tax=Micromonospora sp. MA102 TaxID=2952755 RepID=UPI0021C857F8|nr:hypothetical protein [Micromonospora sp. MA102]
MRDDDPTFVELMQRELHAVRWPEPAELRARARRRSRRTALAAALAVLAVASGTALVEAGRAAPHTALPAAAPASAEPTATPWTATEVPAEVLLAPADLGTRTGVPLTEAGVREDVRLDDLLLYCRKHQSLSTDWAQSRYSRSVTILRERPAADEQRTDQVLAMQDVYRVAPDVADRVFAGMGELLAPCRQWRFSGPTQWRGRTVNAQVVQSWQEVDHDFAGDDSVLLRHTVGPARNLDTGKPLGDLSKPNSRVVLRVGDLVSVIQVGRDGTEADLRKLAVVAAGRMCSAAHPRC